MPDKHKDIAVVSLILRLSLAFVFFYAAIASIRQPVVWSVYLPNFLTRAIPATLLIKFVAIYEILLAGWLLIGKYTKYAAFLSAATLAGIVITNPSQFTNTFRDVGLTLTAVALSLLEK